MLTHHMNDATRAAMPVSRLPAILLGLALAAFGAAAYAAEPDIEIVSVKGDVRVLAAGKESPAKAGGTLVLPSTVRTGQDGSTDLRQGDTTIGIGPGTELDFPASGAPDDAVDRIVQPLGSAFYNVGPRGNRRLRVETPYLVAVIKGTQFNIAVEPDGGTISLYEGSLEILAPDIGASVMLNAGEIASRHRGDDAIRVIPMREGATPSPSSKGPTKNSTDPDGPVVVGQDGAGPKVSDPVVTPIDALEGKVTLDAEVDAGVDLSAGTVDASVATGVDAGVDAGVDLGTGTVDAGVDAGVDLGAGPIDAGVDAGLDAGVDLGAGTVDAGLDLGVDTDVVDADLGGDSLIDVDVGSTPETDDSGGLLGGVLRRIGI